MTLLYWIQLPEKRTFPWYSELYQSENTANNRTRGNHSIRGNWMGGIWGQRKKVNIRSYNLKTYL